MKTKIVRSAVGSFASNGFLKFLKENDIFIIGTDITDQSVGKFLCDSFYIVPKATDPISVVEKYKEIAAKEKASWIVSGPETEIEILIKEKDRIGCGIFHMPYETFQKTTDKYLLSQLFLKETSIKSPYTILLSDYNESIAGNFDTHKLVLKPRKGRGSAGVYFADKNEVELYKKKLNVADYIVQPFIEGVEYTVDTLHDFEGKLLNVVPRQRINVDSGISTIAKTVKDEKFSEIITSMSSQVKFTAGNCIQFIKSREGVYYLTDVNPRFGGGSILSIRASKSFANNIVSLLKGMPERIDKDIFSFKEVTMYRGYEEYFSK